MTRVSAAGAADAAARETGPATVLEVTDLRVSIPTAGGPVHAADGVSFTLAAGETLGVVGETGSGKSVTCRALLGLRPTPATEVTGRVVYTGVDGANVLELGGRALRSRWGTYVAMVPQNPMTSLNPLQRIGQQIGEAVGAHGGLSGRARRAAVVDLMDRVGIPAAARRLDDYPHQFSGGMLQRTLIAIALAGNPRILVADEPTTALDVLVQDQILVLLRDLQRDLGMALILVSHDLSVVSQMSDRTAVMYAGQFVEHSPTPALLDQPRHPYSEALLRALPGAVARDQPLAVIPGSPPHLVGLTDTCRFAPRCDWVQPACREWRTELIAVAPSGSGRSVRCRRHEDVAAGRAGPMNQHINEESAVVNEETLS